MRIIIPTAIITPILLLTGIHVANALTNATCTSTNGTCTVDNFSQHPDGSLELYAWTITSQTDSTRIQLFDPDSDLVGVSASENPQAEQAQTAGHGMAAEYMVCRSVAMHRGLQSCASQLAAATPVKFSANSTTAAATRALPS